MSIQKRGISTHAPAQGATLDSFSSYSSKPRFQPTLPHRERRAVPFPDGTSLRYFNPRSRTGSDVISIGSLDLLPHFNPRSRTGSDALGFEPYEQEVSISTHAPAQGATRAAIPNRPTRRNFNPRSRTGSDHPAARHSPRRWIFQPTLPHRERQILS